MGKSPHFDDRIVPVMFQLMAIINPSSVADGRTAVAKDAASTTPRRDQRMNCRTNPSRQMPRIGRATPRTEQSATVVARGRTRGKKARANNTGTIHEWPLMSEKKRILAVDDKASNTGLVKHFLEQTNQYFVREENDPNAVLAAAKEFRPHLILLDVMMPGLDSGNLAARFQSNRELNSIPIVFLTAAVTKEEIGASSGPTRRHFHLATPVVLTEMVACLERHFGR